MSSKHTTEVINSFLKDEEQKVLVIKGVWGSGKTYVWEDAFKEYKKDYKLPSSRFLFFKNVYSDIKGAYSAIKKTPASIKSYISSETPKTNIEETQKLSNYSYVSLFGISSLRDLKLAIAMNIEVLRDNSKTYKGIKKISKKIPSLFDGVKNKLPYIKDISFSAESVLPYLIKNTIICFDDFERLSTDGTISAEEVLGFISELKEKKNCKVVVIFNEEKLEKSKETYELYKEKIIDIELIHSANINEISDIVFETNNEKEYLLGCCNELNIYNIRTLKKINYFSQKIMKSIDPDIHEKIKNRVLRTLVLAVACKYKTDESLADIKFLSEIRRYQLSLLIKNDSSAKNSTNNKKEDEWFKKISTYQKWPAFKDFIDRLDGVIIKFIIYGYLDDTDFKSAIHYFNEKEHAADRYKKAISTIDDILNQSFHKNGSEFIKKTSEAFKEAIRDIDMAELDKLFLMYDKLAEDSKMQEEVTNALNNLTDDFIKNRLTKENALNFLKISISNELLESRLKEAASKLIVPVGYSLERDIWEILDHNVSDDVLSFLANVPKDEYCNFFKSVNDARLYDLIQKYPSYRSGFGFEINKNITFALHTIYKEGDALNKLRLKFLYSLGESFFDSLKYDE